MDRDEAHRAALALAVGRIAHRVTELRRGGAAEAAAPPPEPPADGRLAALIARAELDATAGAALALLDAAEASAAVVADLARLSLDPAPGRGGVEASALTTVLEYGGHDGAAIATALSADGALAHRGLIRALRDDTTGPARRLAIAPRVAAHLRGAALDAPAEPAGALEPVRPLAELVVDDEATARAPSVIDAVLAPGDQRTLWVSGPRGVGRRALLAALAAARGLRLWCVDYRAALAAGAALPAILWREHLVAGVLPCVVGVEPATGDAAHLIPALHAAVARAGVPVVLVSVAQPVLGDLELPPVTLHLPNPRGAARAALWARLLPEVDRVAEIAPQYRLPPGRIVRVADAARAAAAAARRAPVLADVTRAVSAEISQKITVLGDKVTGTQTWDDLVLPAATIDAMREIVARARWRHRVLEEWGFAKKLAKGLGVSALFAGPPGTGKTMCASIIAAELALELYQIDLSRVVSKYIGETEKNLSEVFEAADWGNVLLLFDEADALFAKRTEVKSSNDRFSNMEVNYLLTRLEKFDGVAILTTNLEGSLDPAFKRRLTFRVPFAMPDVAERELLWRRMVPAAAPVDGAIDFAGLARDYELAGGHIRNAMLRAAFLAAGEDRGITTDHVRRAVALEYRDAGKLSVGGRLQ